MTVISCLRRSDGSCVVFAGRAITSWPDGWFQALKARWLPRRLKAIWPPRLKHEEVAFTVKIGEGRIAPLERLVDSGIKQWSCKRMSIWV